MALRHWLFFILLISFSLAISACSTLSNWNAEREAHSSAALQKTDEEVIAENEPLHQPQGQNYAKAGESGGNEAFGNRERRRRRYGAVSFSQEELKSIEIETAKAAYRSLRAFHSALGKVLAPKPRMAEVSYAFPARISAIHVQIGDWVKQGQPVFTLQSEEVGNAKTEFYKAIADCDLAKANYERETRLFERGAGVQKNVLSTEAEYKVAQAFLEASHKKLHVLGFSEEDVELISKTHQISSSITINAPLSGKVVEHNAVLGQMIDQTTKLLTVLDPTILWVDAEIFERDIAKIKIGQHVQVSVPAYPGEVFAGKLSYISEILSDDTRTITVRTEVDNRHLKLKPGMFADIKIFLADSHKALVVPDSAILDDQNEQIVFIKVADQFAPRVVQLGTRQDGYYEVLGGLREGDEVVTKGSFQLKSKLYDESLGQLH